MAKAIHELTEQNPLEEDMIPIERETSTDVYSGYRLSAESLMKSHLAGKGVNLLPYLRGYIKTPYPAIDHIYSTHEILSGGPLSGEPYIRMTHDGDSTYFAVLLKPENYTTLTNYNVDIEPGKKYLFSAYLRFSVATTVDASAAIIITDGSEYQFCWGEITTLTAGDWKRYSFLIDIPDLTTYTKGCLRIQANSSVTGAIMDIADIMLEEYIGDGTNTIPSAYIPPVYIPE